MTAFDEMAVFDELRERCASDPAALARIDAQERETRAAQDNRPAAVPPCPSWCQHAELFPDTPHNYDSVLTAEPRTYVRSHFSGQHGPDVVQEERNRGGVVTLGEPHIVCEEQEMTAAQVRAHAAALLSAAEVLDGIMSRL